MEPSAWRGASCVPVARETLVVSAICFLRQSLVEILSHAPEVRVSGEAGSLDRAVELARATRPAIILMDAAFPGGTQSARVISSAANESSLIALGIHETEQDVLAWAEAGAAGYVPDTATVDDLITLIGQISRGEQACPSNIAGSLLRRVAASHRSTVAEPTGPALTRREIEILSLLGEGLSNKDIARRLRISLGTTKSHVHNLLGKLGLPRRAEVMARLGSWVDRGTSASGRRPNEIDPPPTFALAGVDPQSILR
jgi:two-component system nitrate/nitrite response regulator NarL